ncbi:hypothetical protein [Streptomyces achromogenes]|uniref:hypothetical protein n=1 Tax=Streptomyces achromogenes TaxID=67255 RepID=UPI003682FDB6
MSTEREYEAEAHAPQAAGGTPDVRPNVYHPLPAPAPAYEEYADPAAAHGWQNDYDATRELPPVTGAAGVPGRPAEPAPPKPSGTGARRAGRGRARRRAGGRRRVVVAGGALAAVAGTVAVIAALSGTGHPDGSRPADGGRIADAPTTHGDGTDGDGTDGDTTPSTVPPASAPATATRSAVAAPSGTTAAPATPRPGTTASGPDGGRPATTAPPVTRPATPTVTASPTASPSYRPGGPHRGHGAPRWPR